MAYALPSIKVAEGYFRDDCTISRYTIRTKSLYEETLPIIISSKFSGHSNERKLKPRVDWLNLPSIKVAEGYFRDDSGDSINNVKFYMIRSVSPLPICNAASGSCNQSERALQKAHVL
jgi:hypothetical protein